MGRREQNTATDWLRGQPIQGYETMEYDGYLIKSAWMMEGRD